MHVGTRPNPDEAGATPPFHAPCVTASVGSLPPQSRAARDPFSRVPEPESRSCKTTSITPRKGESKDKDQSPRNTIQDGNLPRFMMSRASKASWTGMLNSVMILVFLWLPGGYANFPKKTNYVIEVFPFQGLLTVVGSIASKRLDPWLQ